MKQKKTFGTKTGAVIAALVVIAYMLIWAFLLGATTVFAGAEAWLIILMMLIPIVVIIGLIIALRERIKEIEGGEEDEASKY